jgi:hypothetical protein
MLPTFNAFTRTKYSFQGWSTRKFIVTLDPNKFAEKKQQRFHIGDMKFFQPCIMLHNQSRPVGVRQIFYETKTPYYPPDTKAFLYYFAPPEGLRIAGELRLRVTSMILHLSTAGLTS